MYNLKAPILNLTFIILITLSLSACDQQSIIITPEYLSVEDLSMELKQAINQELSKELDQEALEISRIDNGLSLKGNSALITKVITIAKRLDIPSSYYLEVRNTPINTISTAIETMRILLHPDQTISLGHITLIESPWKSLIKQHESSLQLHLSSSFVLSIDIVSQQYTQASSYSGKHPMQLGEWIMAFNNSEMKQGKKIITSRPKKQLWLRLIKANNQSGIRLR